MAEKTLAIIKPDAVKKRAAGKIISRIEEEGFTILELRMRRLTREEAETFYGVHQSKAFFRSLVEFMTSGPIITMVLEKENAVKHWREVMGSTNPAEAAPGSIRRLYGFSIERNATHGSDAEETAVFEIGCLFGKS